MRRHRLVGIDTSIFIYQFELSPQYAERAETVLTLIEAGAIRGVTSLMTLLELTVQPLIAKRQDVADHYEILVTTFPNLTVVGFDRATMRLAANLRASHRLKTPDALQIAASIQDGATGFVTNDRGLRRVTECEILVLDEYP